MDQNGSPFGTDFDLSDPASAGILIEPNTSEFVGGLLTAGNI
jgi:hypothetical protein